jgi:4-amino-4-deoxy-L-arabinose transferase-like glycosyltransferase
VHPPWFYGPVFVVAFFPWCIPVGLALVRVLGRRRSAAARTALYCAAGLLMGLLFFSLGKGKLASYLLPLAPLVAILATWELGQQIEERRERMLGSGLLTLALGVMALVLGTAGSLPRVGPLRGWAWGGAALYGVAALLSTGGILRRSPRWVHGTAAAASMLFLLAGGFGFFPALGRTRSAAPLVAAFPVLHSDRPIVVVDAWVPSLTYYADRSVEEVPLAHLPARLDRPDRPLVILVDADMPRVSPPLRQRLGLLGRSGKLLLHEERE